MNLKSEIAVTETVKLSKRHTVEMTMGVLGATCEWYGPIPTFGDLTRQERRRYLAAQLRLHNRLVEITGLKLALVTGDETGAPLLHY